MPLPSLIKVSANHKICTPKFTDLASDLLNPIMHEPAMSGTQGLSRSKLTQALTDLTPAPLNLNQLNFAGNDSKEAPSPTPPSKYQHCAKLSIHMLIELQRP